MQPIRSRATPAALLLLLLTAVLSVNAQSPPLRFSNVFGSSMVLQRQRPTPVWGWAPFSTLVNVSVSSSPPASYTTVADGAGLWRVTLPPTPASATPVNITAAAPGHPTVVLQDVLFGEVLLCSGQSNMQFTLNDAHDGAAEVADADHYPLIRLFSGPVQEGYKLDSIPKGEAAELVSIGPWSVASRATVAKPNQGSDWQYFSAVCWLTARDLFVSLNSSVPVGAVTQSYGGTSIQWWSSGAALASCAAVAAPGSSCCSFGGYDSCLFNSQVAPYTVGPMQFAAVVWYQGGLSRAAVGAARLLCRT